MIDRWGNSVSLASTLEAPFGGGVMAPGSAAAGEPSAGFVLNNQLQDFSETGDTNRVDAHKRPRTSMTPTIVVKDGRPALVVGGAGGPTVIMGALQAVVNTVDFKLNVAHALDAERIDASFFDFDLMTLEDARVEPSVQADLRGRFHTWESLGEYGPMPWMQAAGTDSDGTRRTAASDPRGEWGAAGQSE